LPCSSDLAERLRARELLSGDLGTARTIAEGMVRIGRGSGSRFDEAIGEWLLGTLAHGQGRHDAARTHLQASRALSTEPRLPLPMGRSLLGLAALAEQDENLDDAWELAHDAVEILDGYGDPAGAAAALMSWSTTSSPTSTALVQGQE
jgi:hypothetical protein